MLNGTHWFPLTIHRRKHDSALAFSYAAFTTRFPLKKSKISLAPLMTSHSPQTAQDVIDLITPPRPSDFDLPWLVSQNTLVVLIFFLWTGNLFNFSFSKRTNSLGVMILSTSFNFFFSFPLWLYTAPALCVIDIFKMFLMLLTAPQGLKIHTINIFKYQIFLTGFRWAKIFHHGATKTPIVGNPAKLISNGQLLLKKLRNNDKTLCSCLSYNIIPNLGLFSLLMF